jgi:hypothetical protein
MTRRGYTPRPGDIGIMATRGFLAWGIRWFLGSTVNHAVIYLGGGWVVSCEYGGARRMRVDAFPDTTWSRFPLTARQRYLIVHWSRTHLDTAYNWVDFVALGIGIALRWKTPAFILRRLSRPDRLQCAQMADLAYARADVHLFDGLMPGAVTPGSLERLFRMYGFM